MAAQQGLYALLQFSPIPERMEFLNVGAVLIVPEQSYVGVRLAENFRRVERLFGKQSKSYVENLKASFRKRLEVEFSGEFHRDKFDYFLKSRANDLRLSKAQPILVHDAPADLDELFEELVGDDVQAVKLPKITKQFGEKLRRAGVTPFVENPDPVDLPQGVTIKAHFAYQNGNYNLIDPVRLSGDTGIALKEASKRAIEGQWLRSHSANTDHPKRLVVVGEFDPKKSDFYHAVEGMMVNHGVKLYRLDEIDPLIEDIKANAKLHGLA